MREKPIQHRFYVPAILTASLAAARAQPPTEPPAHQPLREAEAVARALARGSLEDIVAGSIDVLEADVVSSRRWNNPVLSFTFEQAKGGAGGADEGIYFLQQKVEPGRRRRLRTDAARARVEGAEGRAAMLRVEVEARVRQAFYQVLASRLRMEAAQDWSARMARMTEVVELRRRAGDASGFDQQWVARELATVRAAISAEAAELAEAAATLAGMIGGLPDLPGPQVAGELLEPDPPGFLGDLLRRVELRPDVRALQEDARAAGYEAAIAEGWKMPYFTIGAGYKDVRDSTGDLDGPVAYAAVPLPVLNRQEGPARKASARHRQALGSARMLVEEAQGKVRGTYTKERRLASVAQRFRTEALDPAEDLLRTAEAAYEAGEVGVFRLLDAYRSAHEARRQYLDLALRARQARIELERLTGGRQP